jgi:hypothetical protein
LFPPKDPSFFGQVIAALRLVAQERPPKNGVEKSVLEALTAQNVKASVAKKLLGTLNAVPADDRARFLGTVVDPTFSIAEAVLEHPTASAGGTTTAFHNAASSVVGNMDLAAEPDHPVRYTIRYVGLFCQEETNGPGSDEIYAITSAIHIRDGINIPTDAVRHPLNYPGNYYENIDSADSRVGPVASAWHDNADPVSLVVVVMEHDEGDPNAYRDEIDAAVKAAIAVATRLYPPLAVLALVEKQIVDLINWLVDTDDDLISTETLVLSRADLDNYSKQSRTYYMGTKTTISGFGLGTSITVTPLTTQLFQHFVTKHNGEGAKYVVGFDVLREPPLDSSPIFL